jgi:hypothetical protein
VFEKETQREKLQPFKRIETSWRRGAHPNVHLQTRAVGVREREKSSLAGSVVREREFGLGGLHDTSRRKVVNPGESLYLFPVTNTTTTYNNNNNNNNNDNNSNRNSNSNSAAMSGAPAKLKLRGLHRCLGVGFDRQK